MDTLQDGKTETQPKLFHFQNQIKSNEFFRIYNLTTALYGETEKHASAGVVVRANSTFKSFEDLRGAKACFSEFNGIGMVFE